MNGRVLDIVGQWEFDKTYTLEEMVFDKVEQWDKNNESAYLYDLGNLLTYAFSHSHHLSEQDLLRLSALKKNVELMYLDRDKYPANFYTDSKVYKYKHRSCTNCLSRPTCILHHNKDWSVKWVDNGKAGCTRYCGPYANEKRLKSRYNED